MNRIDLGWQARWETLKLLTKEAHAKCGKDSDIREAFETLLSTMDMLEKAEKPCLSRAVVPYPSPGTGEQRAVFDPLSVNPELPDKKKEISE